MIAYRTTVTETIVYADGSKRIDYIPAAADADTFRTPADIRIGPDSVTRGYLAMDYTIADVPNLCRKWERFLNTLRVPHYHEMKRDNGTRCYRVFASCDMHEMLGRCKHLRIRYGESARYVPTLALREMR